MRLEENSGGVFKSHQTAFTGRLISLLGKHADVVGDSPLIFFFEDGSGVLSRMQTMQFLGLSRGRQRFRQVKLL